MLTLRGEDGFVGVVDVGDDVSQELGACPVFAYVIIRILSVHKRILLLNLQVFTSLLTISKTHSYSKGVTIPI
jgi:hypothetical protein